MRHIAYVGMSSLAIALSLAGCAATGGSRTSAVTTAEIQRGMTPDGVLADLRAGNERFVSSRSTSYDWLAQAERTAGGQYPKAIILSCLDSRVPVEVVFDQGIGDIFVGRVAGNIEDVDQLGSMQFGTKVAGARLIVVLGHTECGAVKGAIDRAELGNLTALLESIDAAIATVPTGGLGRTSKDGAYVDRAVEANVRHTVRDILAQSTVLSDLVAAGDLRVVGAAYDLRSGRVRWLDA